MISHARLKFNVEPAISAFQEEVRLLTGDWITHFNYKHFEGEWTVLPLRSPGGRADQIIPDPLNKEDYGDTRLLATCPAIQAWLGKWKCPLLAVRLLNLKTNSIIKEHRDHELAFENGEARLHIPIFTNPNVEFYLNNELVKMNEGECWYINANLLHRVSNMGTTDRIHLVMDCRVNDWLEKLFEQAELYHVDNHSTDETRKIIAELRMQNTAVSNRLADELENKMNETI